MQPHFSKMVVLAGLSIPLSAVQSDPPAGSTRTVTVHDGAAAAYAGYVNHDGEAIAAVFEGTANNARRGTGNYLPDVPPPGCSVLGWYSWPASLSMGRSTISGHETSSCRRRLENSPELSGRSRI